MVNDNNLRKASKKKKIQLEQLMIELASVPPWTISGNLFDPGKKVHIRLVEKYIKEVELSFSALQAIDVKLIAVFVAGAMGYALSPTIPLLIPFATAAIAYGVQKIEERGTKYDAYEKALTELTKACEWIMEDLEKDTFEEIIKNETVAKMLTMLAPITKAGDLNELKINDHDVKKSLVDHVDGLKKVGVKFWDINIEGQRKLKLFYKIYGKDQGVLAILTAVVQAIKSAFQYLFSSNDSAKLTVEKSEPNEANSAEDDEAHGPEVPNPT